MLDANPDVTSKPALFKRVWAEQYKGIVEYRPTHKVQGVDGAGKTLKIELQDDVRADVLNVLPPMRAGAIAAAAGLANQMQNRWCAVDFQTLRVGRCTRTCMSWAIPSWRATACPRAATWPTSTPRWQPRRSSRGSRAGTSPAAPMINNTCYSFVDDQRT